MEICWDNLEKIRYNPKTGNFRAGTYTCYVFDSCVECKNSYIGKKNSVYCSPKCRNTLLKDRDVSENTRRKMRAAGKIKSFSDTHRQKIGESLKGRARPPFSEDHKQNMKCNHADFSKEKNPMYGKKRLDMIGSNHWNWKGGISCNPYCIIWSEKEWKYYLKHERDKNECWSPYCNGKHIYKLTLHHINYDKKDCNGENLITLCCSCNSKANMDREWHEAWYTEIMIKRGYK